MNLEQAIHSHWTGSESLTALLTADRFTTGRTSVVTVPHATLDVRTVQPLLSTNQGAAMERASLRIHVWHEAYDEGRAIAEQVVETFDGAAIEMSGSTRVARLCHTSNSIRQLDDGLWHWTVKFKAHVCLLL